MKHRQGRTEKLCLLTGLRGPSSGDVTGLWTDLQLSSVFIPLRRYGVGGGGCEVLVGPLGRVCHKCVLPTSVCK